MERYRNLNGHSGVAAYEIGDDFMRVRFNSGTVYLYTMESVGAQHLTALKQRTWRGQGLSAYIS
ncbi:MAG: hypothetical protein CPDRYMAC_4620 [uncultured Paraburkholderia sp.]|nr:MAG: hypothetical protein CPDRYDRY_4481 [uncultured Paraburkholderia sp.]CAH2937543.1 MAG: hypothetical protein CPDRYMAC_4620 [uncultured Paraburkholderia sp.]